MTITQALDKISSVVIDGRCTPIEEHDEAELLVAAMTIVRADREQAVADEREQCARVADRMAEMCGPRGDWPDLESARRAANDIAAAIRGRPPQGVPGACPPPKTPLPARERARIIMDRIERHGTGGLLDFLAGHIYAAEMVARGTP